MTYREAIRSALREALHSDPRVFLMGEDVGKYGGALTVENLRKAGIPVDRPMPVPFPADGEFVPPPPPREKAREGGTP